MSKKTTKEKTPTQKLRTLRAWQYTTFWGQFVAMATPYVAIGIANFDKYFVEYNGTKISIGFFLAMGVFGFTIAIITSKKLKDSYISFLIKMVTLTIGLFLIEEIIYDLKYIVLFGCFGILAASGLEIAHKKLKEKADRSAENKKASEDEREIEEYRAEAEEKETKKIKVKIKK